MLVFHSSARGPSDLMVRVSDQYSEGLGFKFQLDPRFFPWIYLFLTLSEKKHLIICECSCLSSSLVHTLCTSAAITMKLIVIMNLSCFRSTSSSTIQRFMRFVKTGGSGLLCIVVLSWSHERAPIDGAPYKSTKEGSGHSFQVFMHLLNQEPVYVYHPLPSK